ncbi:sulfatase-like hydrolase/transferase [Ancylomarina sp. 16SWW S1-10-2]|uniref:sulfatase-like hydrolase/transferase n=1 Tax=Ancylomarina sp. 16SWW S1-10-2 TaxID=2499681 RepID=UPI0012AD7171|nr:sulfatase-like hydrolase/transferase [Ancylomarina sp. 16SWW S1-10-2]MRT91959.1 hypothetical protein [Ancylomarina sp. 16SWW S1-10-2]
MYSNRLICKGLILTLLISFIAPILSNQNLQAKNNKKKPNLIFIMTDEQSYLTIGSYRDFLPEELACRWGENIAPNTPNLDKIAEEGAIYTSYYASAPVCSPSRASIFTGCYPDKVGVPLNGCGLRHDATTIGQALKDQDYATSYIGKWHLADNEPIPGWQFTPSLGFDDNTYMFNTGHQKYYVVGRDPKHITLTNNPKPVPGKLVVPCTKFLTDKALDVIKENKDQPFCLVLSIPDPHSPDIAVPPYDKMYADLDYHAPSTYHQKVEDRPKWARSELSNEVGVEFDKSHIINYFGMVTDIDDNIGRIMEALKKHKIDDNTIVVFTADHGELNFEHHRINKGLPFETSAHVPLIIRYPNKIRKGKVISTPHVNVDLMPTLLQLMDVPQIQGMDGQAFASSLTSKAKYVDTKRIVYGTSTFNWVMATDGRYKLVLSTVDTPWLYDLKTDPLEIKNCFRDSAYKSVSDTIMKSLIAQMNKYKEPRYLDKVNPLIYK